MSSTSVVIGSGLSRIKLFMALSRTPHGLLDMATPALAAMLWLGQSPPAVTALLGILTAFAGYTAVYALNDVVDYRTDTRKMACISLESCDGDLDSVYARHPIAQGLLSLHEGILWTVAWAVVALVGAWTLNPVSALIFIGGCVAEAIYCLMLQVSFARTFVSGAVKTAGAMAAVYAVVPDPSPLFLSMLFLWLFCWEIGGQNVPNDWTDRDEDIGLNAVTIPVRFGPARSADIIAGTLSSAVLLSLALYLATPANLGPQYIAGALVVGAVLLIIPAMRLRRSPSAVNASILFNRASWYPLCMFGVVLFS